MARKRSIFSARVQLQPLLSGGRKYRRLFIMVLGVALGLFLSLYPAWSQTAPELPENKALELAQAGQKRYNAGLFDQAAELWQKSAEAYQEAGNREGVVKSRINQAQALQDLGLFPKACQALVPVFTEDRPNCSREQLEQLAGTLSQNPTALSSLEATGLGSFGEVLRRQGRLEQSRAFLQLSLAAAEKSSIESDTLLSLGNTERALGNQIRNRLDYEEVTAIIDQQWVDSALGAYQNALAAYRRAATTATEPINQIKAQLNQFSLLMELKKWWNEQTNRRLASWQRLDQPKLVKRGETFLAQLQSQLTDDAQNLQRQIAINFEDLPATRSTIYPRLNFAQSLLQLGEYEDAKAQIEKALAEARSMGDRRGEAYAIGYLGQVHSQRGNLDEALELTQQALLLAQEQSINGDAREIVYLWQSQLGSLQEAQGDTSGAIVSYTAAFNTLQSLRTDLNVNFQEIRFDFREKVKPVYLRLADLLLQSDLTEAQLKSLLVINPGATNGNSQLKTVNNRLQLAQRVIESLQLAELDNFFQDPCAEEADVAVQIEDLDAQAAVIYPIIFKDRLEIILSLPDSLSQATVAVSELEVNKTLDQLYDSLDNPTIDNSALNIFATLNPDPEELRENLQTLLPIFAQVYDWLIRPFETELNNRQVETLVFAINGRLQKVPLAALYDGQRYLIEKYSIGLVPSLQLVNPSQFQQKPLKVLAAGVSKSVQVQGETFPALEYVPEELAQIEAVFPSSQKLLNEEFTQDSLSRQLQGDFPVVHLATHAQFSSDPQKNFIVTGEGNSISIDQLSDLFKSGTAQAPELLVLSACQTATGDEQAILGLAGVAVRSGASSTMATLWSVDDASTARLMGQFYQQLEKPGGKKIEALRNAQMLLMESAKLNPAFEGLDGLPPHPYSWAPYVIVGSWQ